MTTYISQPEIQLEAPAALTLSNGLNSDIVFTNNRNRIAGPSAGFSVGGFVVPEIGSGNNVKGDGLFLKLYNSTAQQMTLVNEDMSSAAENRIRTLTGADIVLRSGPSFATLSYDGNGQRWIVESTN